MSLVSASIANLINGVSQQPNALRLASQCELQENCDSSVVDGLRPRVGSRHSAKISATSYASAFTHTINRDQQERYEIIIPGDGTMKVYDLDGVQKTVTIGDGASAYITSATPQTSLSALTVADYTFLLNQDKVVAIAATTVPDRAPEALVWVRAGTSKSKYTITVDSYTGTYTCGDATDTLSQGTDTIAAGLVAALQIAMGGAASAYTIAVVSSTIWIRRVNGLDFVVSTTDSMGDAGTVLIKGNTQRFTNLPARAVDGFKTSIEGEGGSFNTTYWVEYQSDALTPFGGVWRETAAPSQFNGLNQFTMPHALIRQADGTFVFDKLTWDTKSVGDAETNPQPSFVGNTINDIFFHRNRLGFLSDENLVMSRNGEFFNFYKSSAIQLIDTDPIDVGVSHTKVSILRHAVPFNESLLLFSDQTQFILGRTGDVLTSKNVSIDQTTEYECSLSVKPVGAGSNVYFVQNKGEWSSVREFAVDADTQTKDAQDITAHVPKYVPKNVYKLAVSNTQSIIVALSRDTPNILYVYQYHISDNAKLQSAWHKWVFPETDTVLNADFIESDLRLCISRADGTYLETIPVRAGFVEEDTEFSMHLDRMVNEDQVTGLAYDSVARTTTFTLPYLPQAGEEYVLVAWLGTTGYRIGQKVPFTLVGANVTVPGANSLSHFRFGRKFTARYVFSQLQVQEEAKGGGQIAVSEGRINIRRLTTVHGASGYFRVEVSPRGRDTYRYVMSGRQVGSSTSLLGHVALAEGSFRVPIMARNSDVTIEIKSDEFLPFAILSAGWEGVYVIRSRRI